MKQKLKIHTLQHVQFEGLGCIEQWIAKKGHSVNYTRLYDKPQFPTLNEFDWLIVMGGPMGVYDEAIYPWLREEKEFIRQAIESGKTVVGICLGSQLIAEVLGAKVYPNKQKEIGWFDIHKTEFAKRDPLLEQLEEEFIVFHWHGDTFDLPAESERLFSSAVCLNQAFLYKKKVLGLQFHFEVTPHTLKEMIENGRNELVEDKTIQSATKILEQTNYFESNNQKMFRILDYLEKE
ncbi:MAG: type 1 glutamine amidotransferase [Paludibacter sp.]|nr:type 1 glutamine amidotransferase [Paludibacter sp.]